MNQKNIMSDDSDSKAQSNYSTPKSNPTPTRKENRQINIRISEEEYERLSVMSDGLGVSVAHFCKNKVLGIKTKAPKINREAGMEIAYELRKISVSFSQIAKGVNVARKDSGFSIAVNEVDEVREIFEGIRREFEDGMVRIWGLLE